MSKNERTYNDWADCEDEEWQVNTEDNDRWLSSPAETTIDWAVASVITAAVP